MPQVRLRIPKRRSLLAARRCAVDPPPRRRLALLSRLPEYGLELCRAEWEEGEEGQIILSVRETLHLPSTNV